MILTRSPYYLDILWLQVGFPAVPEKYILQLYIWNGLKASVPTEPTYEKENKNPLGRLGTSSVNISNYINSEIDLSLRYTLATDVVGSESAVWVKTQVIYYIEGVAQTPYYVSTDLAIKGYGYGIEGRNTTIPTNNILSSVNFANVGSNSVYLLPIKISETESVDIDIVSLPNNNLVYNYTFAANTDSAELIKDVIVKCSEIGTDKSVQIKYNDEVIHTLILKDEPKYTPIDIVFINKFGQRQTTTFFKDKVDSLSVDNESYEASNGQPINGVHQFVNYNTNGKYEFKIYSGFVKEGYNEIIKQMYLSDKLWQLKDNVYIPLNRKSKTIEFQTRQRDRLLNYEVSFEYAFNEINNA